MSGQSLARQRGRAVLATVRRRRAATALVSRLRAALLRAALLRTALLRTALLRARATKAGRRIADANGRGAATRATMTLM